MSNEQIISDYKAWKLNRDIACGDQPIEPFEVWQAAHARYAGSGAESVGYMVPDLIPMEPFQTIDAGSKNYKAGWNACREAMLTQATKES